ncbi:MAG: serine hydrolase [Bryobacterales bacterium]|nr:serine hydrolase [Bryobacterales bacterium]
MMRNSWFLLLAAAAVACAAPPTDEQIRRILVEQIDTRRQAVGIVVGIVEPGGVRRIVAHGVASKGGPAVDGGTLMEIGSITKVFTAQLLAGAVQRGAVKLDDPVSKFLPAEAKMPEWQGRAITLHDLVSHRSGLPRLPGNLQIADISNPYAAYTVTQLYAFLAGHQLRRAPDTEFEYSNLGAGLLGHALARQAGLSYEELVRAKILDPLRMKDTGIALSPAARARLAQGHNAKLEPVPACDLPALAGAGALRSSASEMLNWLAAHAGLAEGGVNPVLASMLATRRPGLGGSQQQVGLGWMIAKVGGAEMVWHNGGTGGFVSFAGFDPQARVGVVVLSNTAGSPGVDDLGRHLLNSNLPLAEEKRERQQISFDPKRFDAFTGAYRLAPGFALFITREGERFFAQATGQGKNEIFPMSARAFFFKVVDAEIEFGPEQAGRTHRLTLRQNGASIPGERVEGLAPPPDPGAGRTVVAVAPKTLDSYAGKYQLTPGVAIAISRGEAGRMFAQVTGQEKHEIFAESDRRFFFRVVDAQLTFTPGEAGAAAPKLTLHQGGANIEARRVDD